MKVDELTLVVWLTLIALTLFLWSLAIRLGVFWLALSLVLLGLIVCLIHLKGVENGEN